MFGAAAAGAVFVPVNPLLKAEQVAYILRDCNVRVLVTSPERLALLERRSRCVDCARRARRCRGEPAAGRAAPLGRPAGRGPASCAATASSTPTWRRSSTRRAAPASRRASCCRTATWSPAPRASRVPREPPEDDAARGAAAVVRRRVQPAHDGLPRRRARRAAELPAAAGRAERARARSSVTGLTAVPPLWIQLAAARTGRTSDRASTCATSPTPAGACRARRSTRCARALPRREAVPDVRPDRGVPLDLPAARARSTAGPTRSARRSRTPRSWCCARTARPARPTSRASSCIAARWSAWATGTTRRRRPSASSPLPGPRRRRCCMPEIAVFSGDTVRRDEEGFLYFVGRRDEMIKTSGYRVSPTEVEEVLYDTGLVGDAVAFGVADPSARPGDRRSSWPGRRDVDPDALRRVLAKQLPGYMVPAHIDRARAPLPRNPNGKIDRKRSLRPHASWRRHERPPRAHRRGRPVACRRPSAASPLDAARRARRPHAVLRLRPRAAHRARRAAARGAAARRRSCTTR